MRILITGANGLLGTELLHTLSQSHEILGVARSAAPHLNSYRQIDLSKDKAAEELFCSWKPDLVFHCAAMTNVDDCENKKEEAKRLNVDMIQKVVQACNLSGAFPIFFSSDYVFSGEKKSEYFEDDKREPKNFYGETKVLAENYIAENARQFAVFRISWLYGMHGACFPKTILEKAKTQKEFKIVSDQTGRPTYTRDVALAFSDYLKKHPDWKDPLNRQFFHLANEGTVTWADFARVLFECAGLNIRVESITTDQSGRAAKRPLNAILNLDKTSRVLGIKLRSWREAAGDFLKEYGTFKDVTKVSS